MNALTSAKKIRLRKLVAWGYFTVPEACASYKHYLRLFKRTRKLEN